MLAAPHQYVAEVERDRGVPDADLARAGLAERRRPRSASPRVRRSGGNGSPSWASLRASDRTDARMRKKACQDGLPQDRRQGSMTARIKRRSDHGQGSNQDRQSRARARSSRCAGARRGRAREGRAAAPRRGARTSSWSSHLRPGGFQERRACAPTRTTATSASRTPPTAWRWRMSSRFVGPCDPKVVSKMHLHEAEFQMIYVLKGSMTSGVRRATASTP